MVVNRVKGVQCIASRPLKFIIHEKSRYLGLFFTWPLDYVCGRNFVGQHLFTKCSGPSPTRVTYVVNKVYGKIGRKCILKGTVNWVVYA